MEKVYDYLLNDIGLTYGDALVIGVSGGPDSMALLSVAIKLKKAMDINVICAHVNHNSGRPGQYEDQEFVRKYCRENGITFESMIIEEYGDDNFHNEARSIRYNYFEKLIKKYNAKFLFTAHHGDDLIETILMRIVRGSTLRGYSGFSKVVDMGNYKIIRPFIELTKDDIIEYNKKNKISYKEDCSNKKDVYTRNRYRKYIVPGLKKEDIKVHQKFYKFSQTLLEYNNYIDKEVIKIMNKVCPENVINIEEFLKQDHIIQMKIIYSLLEKIYQDDLMLITDKHAELICELIKSNKSNSSVYLPNNYKFTKAYNTLTFQQLNSKLDDYEIEIIDFVNLPNCKNIERIKTSNDTSNNVTFLDSTEVVMPLRVRNRKNGDKMTVKGMLGRKKIGDIFIDDKIPMSEREIWPVVVDSNNNIVWLPGLKKSKFDKSKKEKYDIILRYY